MDICDPEILKAQRYGSRWERGDAALCCRFCGKEAIEEEFICDIAGNIFCDDKCREEFLSTKSGGADYDQE